MSKTGSYWRDKARPIVLGVIAANKDKPINDLRKALYEAYPFGDRKNHPYKIWLDECNAQLHACGLELRKRYWGKPKGKKDAKPDPRQLTLM